MTKKSKALKIGLGTMLMANPLITGVTPVLANEVAYETEYELVEATEQRETRETGDYHPYVRIEIDRLVNPTSIVGVPTYNFTAVYFNIFNSNGDVVVFNDGVTLGTQLLEVDLSIFDESNQLGEGFFTVVFTERAPWGNSHSAEVTFEIRFDEVPVTPEPPTEGNDDEDDDYVGEVAHPILGDLFGYGGNGRITGLAGAVYAELNAIASADGVNFATMTVNEANEWLVDNLYRVTSINVAVTPVTLQNGLQGINLLTGLRSLSISNVANAPEVEINDIALLSGLTNLHELNLYGHNIVDLTPLALLTNLEVLNLGNNNISESAPLANLTNLTDLRLQDNNIGNVSPLSGLVNLTVLWLNNNQISDLSALSGLNTTNIVALGQVTQLAPTTVGTSTELTLLGLGGNTPTLVNDELNGHGEFTFIDNMLTWLTYGENVLVWFDNAEDTLYSFSGTVAQNVGIDSDDSPSDNGSGDKDDTTDNDDDTEDTPQAEVDADSIQVMNNFLNNNTATNRITIPYNARTETEILNAIAYVLGDIDGLADNVTVNLVRQSNTTIANGQVDNITVQLAINPTHDITNQTIYFRHADRPNLPQTGAVQSSFMVLGTLALGTGIVTAITQKKKK